MSPADLLTVLSALLLGAVVGWQARSRHRVERPRGVRLIDLTPPPISRKVWP